MRKKHVFWEFAIEEQVVLWYTKSKCGQFCCAQNNHIERKFHGKTKNNRPACGSGAGAANGIYPRDSSGKRQIFCGNRQTQKVL